MQNIVGDATIFHTNIGANTNFFASNLIPSVVPCIFRVYVVLSVAGILSVQRTNGGTTVAEILNDNVALVANTANTFDIIVNAGDSINFQTTGSGTTILECSVSEIDTMTG